MQIRSKGYDPIKRISAVGSVMLALSAWFAPPLADTGSQTLEITPSFIKGQVVSPSQVLEFRLNRAIVESEGRIGMVIGSTDVSYLLAHTTTSFVYNPSIIRHPVGDNQVFIYLISADNV